MHSADLPSFRHCSHNHRDCGWGLGKYVNAHTLTATPLVAETAAAAAATAIKYAKDGKAHKKTKRTNERTNEGAKAGVCALLSLSLPLPTNGAWLPECQIRLG